MKQLMILAAVVAAGILMTTGCCSTCGKKDGTCTKPTAAASCTNNTFAADFRLACSGSCTNQFNAYLAACPSECTNKPSGGKS